MEVKDKIISVMSLWSDAVNIILNQIPLNYSDEVDRNMIVTEIKNQIERINDAGLIYNVTTEHEIYQRKTVFIIHITTLLFTLKVTFYGGEYQFEKKLL